MAERQADARGRDPGGRRALVFALLGLLLAPFVWPAGLVLVVAGLVLGLRARRRGARAGVAAPGATAAIVIGAVGSAAFLMLVAVLLGFYSEVSAYQECMAGANTETARGECRSALEEALRRRFGRG